MSETFHFSTTVAYGDVDRHECVHLAGIFKFLQEAAIRHANAFDTGTHAIRTRGEAWVLNRVAVGINAYPRYEDPLRIETWSRGISGFRGYREYRVYVRDRPMISASSLWIYVNVTERAPVRVPLEIAEKFPPTGEAAYKADIERLKVEVPELARSLLYQGALRYSDVDSMGHVNNAAYLDLIQSALDRHKAPPHPRGVEIKFQREIPATSERVDVALERREADIRFQIADGNTVFAVGRTVG